MGKINITDLEVSFHVGVPDAERARPQRLLISVELETDFRAAAIGDDITKTINYYDVCQKIAALGKGKSWKLIEKLAQDIALLIFRDFGPDAASITIKKFVLPQTAHVSVSLNMRNPETS